MAAFNTESLSIPFLSPWVTLQLQIGYSAFLQIPRGWKEQILLLCSSKQLLLLWGTGNFISIWWIKFFWKSQEVWSLNCLSVYESIQTYAFGNLTVMLLSDLFYASTCFSSQCFPYIFKEGILNVSLVVKQILNLTEAVVWLQLQSGFMSHSWNDLQILQEVFFKWNLCESYWTVAKKLKCLQNSVR